MIKRTIAILAGVVLPISASAQDYYPALSQQGYVKRIVDDKVQYVRIHEELPPICDVNVIRAATTANGIGSEFYLTGAGDHFKYGTVPTVFDEPQFLEVVLANTSVMTLETWWDQSASAAPYPYFAARVMINGNRFYYSVRSEQDGDFACGDGVSSTNIRKRIDFETAILHEFGHFAGLYHRWDGDTGPCVMAKYIRQGEIKREYCSDEKNYILGFYGPK